MQDDQAHLEASNFIKNQLKALEEENKIGQSASGVSNSNLSFNPQANELSYKEKEKEQLFARIKLLEEDILKHKATEMRLKKQLDEQEELLKDKDMVINMMRAQNTEL